MIKFKLAIAQLNPTVGDFAGNLKLAIDAILQAQSANADIILFTELFLCGYAAEDLLRKPAFLEKSKEAIDKLINFAASLDIAIIIGAPLCEDSFIYNAALFIAKGNIVGKSYKRDLPNYAEFDEKRLFSAGGGSQIFSYRGVSFGVPICEDIWNNESIIKEFVAKKPDIILVPNASPYQHNKINTRIKVVQNYTSKIGCPVVYANQVGGQDGLVFDGASFAYNADGERVLQMPQFNSSLAYIDWQKNDNKWSGTSLANDSQVVFSGEAANYNACIVGLRDYVYKNNFNTVMLGLSGGIDSALCATMAVDALGAENVFCFMLPYHYTTTTSKADALSCAKALGCFYDTISIESAMESLEPLLLNSFDRYKAPKAGEYGLWHENLQSRLRGLILMSLSNKFGHLLLTTGNKSELAVGYCTLYGDTNGGFNPIKDLYKTEIYNLARWRNNNFTKGFKGNNSLIIPENILDKPASAELREGQRDEDSLPPYAVLDKILYELLENDNSIANIAKLGFEQDMVERIENLIYMSEHKRRQSAPGTKLSSKDLSKDRRYPITNKFRDNNRLL